MNSKTTNKNISEYNSISMKLIYTRAFLKLKIKKNPFEIMNENTTWGHQI